jgi:PilZ domain
MDTAGLAKSENGSANASNAGGRDRRVDDRFDLKRAPGTLLYKGTRIPCEMLDVSLSGCRLHTLQPFEAMAFETVKVTLSIEGMVISIWGVTQWITRDWLVGIRFCHPTERTRNELAVLLTCLLQERAADEAKELLPVKAAPAGIPVVLGDSVVVPEDPWQPKWESDGVEAVPEEEFQLPPPPRPPPPRAQLQSENEVLSLEKGESPATLHLVAEGSTLAGNVMDVSQDGCLVQLAKPIAVRLNAQVEVDFRLRGLPFRLPGVARDMRDERTVEIRFVEINRRKQDDLVQIISELILRGKATRKTPSDKVLAK